MKRNGYYFRKIEKKKLYNHFEKKNKKTIKRILFQKYVINFKEENNNLNKTMK